jgi:hypothetical protein
MRLLDSDRFELHVMGTPLAGMRFSVGSFGDSPITPTRPNAHRVGFDALLRCVRSPIDC